jgi:hypothetical protein
MTQLDDLRRERNTIQVTIAHAKLHNAPSKYYKHLQDRIDEITSTINNIR